MTEVALALLVVAMLAYILLGGADFGAGIIEGLLPKEHRNRVDAALSPVWEANHVWLIAAIVISFAGFPRVFSVSTTLLHVPIALALLGIVARGTAFTLRHYDPGQDQAERGRAYRWVFRVSSALTPLLLGACLATLGSGRLRMEGSFADVYLMPWLGFYPLAAGVFAVSLFAFVAATWLATEHPDEDGTLPYLGLARRLHLLCILCGGTTLVAASVTGAPLTYELIRSGPAMLCVGLATVLIAFIAWCFQVGSIRALRVVVALQVAAIFGAFALAQYPAFIRFDDAPELLVADAVAPHASLVAMVGSLGVGLCLVLPGIALLMRVYKSPSETGDDDPAG